MAFTQAQLSAIEHRGGDLLLAAAAGSGKTTVLVERVMRLIMDGHSIENMLIVTFTRAAAADMRGKLSSALSSAADESAHLREQLDLLSSASVTTIHSFCMEILRAHFEAAQVDPTFRLMDDVERAALERRALEDAMEACYESEDECLRQLKVGRRTKAVSKLALSLYRFLIKRPDPEAFVSSALSMLEGDGVEYISELDRAMKRRLLEARALIRQALVLARGEAGLEAYQRTLMADDEMLEEVMRGARTAAELQFERLAARKRTDDARAIALAEQVKALRERAKKLADRERKQSLDIAQALSDLHASAAPVRALLLIAREMDKRVEAEKESRSAFTFDDLESRALRALSREDVAQALRDRYEFVFVDEYQDVSDMQEALIARIARPGGLFMVGDVKQSIYRFRDAEPQLFNEKYRRFSLGDDGRLIALSQNFRSRAAILSLVNDIFERVFVGGDTEIEYTGDARLYPGLETADDPPVELLLVCGGEVDEGEENELSRIEREAVLAARRIRMLIGQDMYDAKRDEMRAIRHADIAVLARTNGALTGVGEVFKAFGIPTLTEGTGSAFDALEIKTALSFLKTIDNRRLDIPLLASLRSPIGGLLSEELAKIRESCPEGAFRDACVEYIQKEDAIARKLSAFEALLNRYARLARALPLPRFVGLTLRETGYYAFASALPGGAERAANLDQLIKRADDFERARGGGLAAFLMHITGAQEAGDPFPAASAQPGGADAVRLMTAHKSKGLEFPVVIALDLSKRLTQKPTDGELLMDRDLGLGMMLNDEALFTSRETLARRAIQEKSGLKDLNEEMRVLYVLLTRARDRLIMIGSVKDLPAARLRWSARTDGVLPDSYLNAIAPVLACRIGGEALALQGAAAGEAVDVRLYDEAEIKLSKLDLPDDTQRILFSLGQALLCCEDTRDHPINARYPHEKVEALPVKLTVTGLLTREQGTKALPKIAVRPRFMTEAGLSSAERGTLLHAALQALELTPMKGLTGAALGGAIDGQLETLVARRILMEKPDTYALQRFFEGDTGKRLLAAETVHREWPFNLRVRAGDVPGYDGDGTLLLQGVIDCCFLEADGYTLLDYKSDAGEPEGIAARYAPQIEMYALALQRITGVPVTQKRLVLLRAGQDIMI